MIMMITITVDTMVSVSTREANSANNGKHAKKEFSGRFINKQDFKLGLSEEKKCKGETTTSGLQWPASRRAENGTSQAGGQRWCGGDDVKKEPLVKTELQTLQNIVDDEVCPLTCNAV